MVPQPVKALGRLLCGTDSLDETMWQTEYDHVLAQARRIGLRTDIKLGIVKDVMLRHSYYEAACLELGVPYEVIDLSGADWQERILSSGCAAFLVRPFVLTSMGKVMYDERIRILAEEMGKRVFPSPKSLWLYESKRRTADWLKANGIAQPRTSVFFDQGKAMDFIESCDLPVVFKTDLGSESFGVRIVRHRNEGKKLVKRCFGRGFATPRYDVGERSRGYILFQEFIPEAREWRVVRIGDSYFGHTKVRKGDFHSGSKQKRFDTPPRAVLDLCRRATDLGDFKNMSLDILETCGGEYLVIELHAYFGCSTPNVMEIDGRPGRYIYSENADEYVFEEGSFNRNASCNLRVMLLLDSLGVNVEA